MSSNLVVIEDATIRSMMQDPKVMDALPCLKGPKTQLDSIKKGGTNCQRCQAERKQIAGDALRTARACIKSARGERLDTIKKALGTRQIRVVAKNAKGRKVKYTL